MDPLYTPEGVETRWQETWEGEGLYAAQADDPRETYVVAFPPPNVTGELHLGHALQLALADALIRWRRMQGYNCLFQPGYDHAGISTQSVVEKHLEREGSSRKELGREAFEERVWEWLRQYGGTIMGQFRRMGASMDYRRERFTMDEGYVRAVLRHFVHLWEKGYLYRDHRIVNWCPYHESALSDLELDHVEQDDELFHIRYPLADGIGLDHDRDRAAGDDPRRRRRSPSTRTTSATAASWARRRSCPSSSARVPIVADERVEPEFGTGALKVTPGHDPVDFEIGRAHGLPEPMVVGPDGRMNDVVPEVAGMTQEEAGALVLAWCEERGPAREARALPAHHRRLRALREPDRAADLAPVVVPHGRAQGTRARGAAHRARPLPPGIAAPLRDRLARERTRLEHLPPDLVGPPDPGLVLPGRSYDRRGDRARGLRGVRLDDLTRDPDVLDTWFSSALWPFATLGWPEDTPDLRRFYPGDFNITAREIIRLWENRMIFSGIELAEKIPFRDVIIHSTVLAPDGRRMSKSLGTGVDPLEVIAEYGADATRYGLAKMSSQQDSRMSYKAIDEGRRLANKLWNVSRLILQNTVGATPEAVPRDLEERWILARIDRVRAEVEEGLAGFDFSDVVQALYHLTFDDFCDWYAEAIKPRLYEDDADAAATALAALERLLALLHPVLPHVTEEIWTQLPERSGRLIVSPWPEPDTRFAADANALDRVQEAAQIFRRSGVEVELDSDDARRIFAAVVRPERTRVDGNRDAEVERLRKEVARAEGMLANERFVQNAPADVVDAEREKLERYRRELAALDPRESG